MSQELRKQVSDTYTQAARQRTSCCGAGNDYAAGIGYSAGELGSLPEDAVSSSFGCGNPLAFSEVEEGEVVLDLGSGAGIDVLLAARKVGPDGRAIGVDMTDEMLERAQANIAASGLENAEVRRGLIEELPVDDASVDWVISNCVINLSPEKERVFAEVHRVLRPGGRFSVSDIVVEEMPDWLKQHRAFYSACVSGAISEEEYLGGLEAAGLEGVEVRERMVYAAVDLRGLVASGEIPLPDDLDPEIVEQGLQALEGKVQSIKVQGRKPSR